jgi:glycosyltransferase involved in cell wall biosynthesis
MKRDNYVDFYHVISNSTEIQLMKYTNKPIFNQPFWVNPKIWFCINSKDSLRKELGFLEDDFLIGSFQRDTEGHDLISPKLSKGPDRFIELVKYYNKVENNLKIVLTGKRREYVISNLKELDIDYEYYEMAPLEKINQLYNVLDLYIVSSRYEGGPQSIMETAATKTPLISTNVGVASEILSPTSIYNMKNYKSAQPNPDIANKNVKKYLIPEGFLEFNDFFDNL